jgi:hypothetical protein
MMLAAMLTTIAIVTQDQAALRAAPKTSAPQQVVLAQGDALEVRGQRMDYLQVYDHRRERAGYVRATQVRTVGIEPEDAPGLLSVVRFLRDTPGSETLGIAYAAAYLKAAPAPTIDAEPFDAIGDMADRLAMRASVLASKGDEAKIASQLEVAASYGVAIRSVEYEGGVRLCPDGEAFRRVLALPATDVQRARAALSLTRPECIDPALSPVARHAIDQWRADVLDRVQTRDLPVVLKNRVRMRRAGVWSTLAFEATRRGESGAAAADRAQDELLGIEKGELADEDQRAYAEAAVRVGSTRWAGDAIATVTKTRLGVVTQPGSPGETCILLTDAKHDVKDPLFRKCTFGTVWTASANVNPSATAMTLAVQPLDAWLELWVFAKGPNGWSVMALPPTVSAPDVGYVEFAGWVPGGKQVLVAREAREEGRWKRRFEVLRLDTLATVRYADKPEALSVFYRWQSPGWKARTVSLR